MKKLVFGALLLVSVSVLGACSGPSEDSESGGVEDFSIDGTWTSEGSELVGPEEGYRTPDATMEVIENEGDTFVADLSYQTPEGEVTDQIVGAMTPDGSLMGGATEGGVYNFSAADENTLNLCFMQAGDNYLAVCSEFTRDG